MEVRRRKFSCGTIRKTLRAWADSARPLCQGERYPGSRETVTDEWTCGTTAATCVVAPIGVLRPF